MPAIDGDIIRESNTHTMELQNKTSPAQSNSKNYYQETHTHEKNIRNEKE